MDSCAWQDRSSLRTGLIAGQNRSGLVVPVQHGYLFKVRVNDPEKQLPAAVGKSADSTVSVTLVGPSGLPKNLPIISQDAGGRDLGIVIPYDVPHKLSVRSSTVALKDGNGRSVDTSAPVDVKVSRGATAPPYVVNVAKSAKASAN